MKSVTGSILMVAAAIFYLARINAQPINFHASINFATTCSKYLAIAGVALIVWGLVDDIVKARKQR